MSGALLGRPCKEKGEQREKKTIMKQDEKDRIPVEGKLGNAKRKYGLNRIMTKRSDTSESTIALIILILNLERILSGFIFVYFAFNKSCCYYGKKNYYKQVEYFYNSYIIF